MLISKERWTYLIIIHCKIKMSVLYSDVGRSTQKRFETEIEWIEENCTENAVCRFVDIFYISPVVVVVVCLIGAKYSIGSITISCLTLLHICFWFSFQIEIEFYGFQLFIRVQCALCTLGELITLNIDQWLYCRPFFQLHFVRLCDANWNSKYSLPL